MQFRAAPLQAADRPARRQVRDSDVDLSNVRNRSRGSDSLAGGRYSRLIAMARRGASEAQHAHPLFRRPGQADVVIAAFDRGDLDPHPKLR